MLEARTDVVGSLVRPVELLDARERCDRGELSAPDFKRIEDAAVDSAPRLQGEARLDVVTDGEMRRLSFQSQASRWLVEGGYEWLAERLFPRVAAHRLLLEYDDARSGSFEPLQAAPDDKIAVFGLVTTKSGRRETSDELAAGLAEASGFCPLERLAVSPQCGFATPVLGNALTVEDQAAKLRTIAETARRVWG